MPQNDCSGGNQKYSLNQVLMHIPHAVSRNVLKRIANMGLMNHAKSRWKIVYDSKNYPLISKFMHLIVAVNFFNTLQFILSELNLKWYSYNKLEKPPFSSLSSFLFWTLFVSAHKHEYLASSASSGMNLWVEIYMI